MDYSANAMNPEYLKAQQNIGMSALGAGAQMNEAPRTVVSAISRMDALNERLCKLRDGCYSLADAIGGPRNTGTDASKGGVELPPAGAVGRLNATADAAHRTLNEIESVLNSITRSLG